MKNFIALLIFFGGVGAWYWHYDTSRTESWIAAVIDQHQNLEKRVAAQRASFALVERAFAAQRKAQDLREAIGIVAARQKVLNGEKSSLSRQQQKVQTGNRQSLVGTVLTDLTLADGRKLSQAKVTKVDDFGVSFLMPSGVVRVNSRDLPPELQKLFHFTP